MRKKTLPGPGWAGLLLLLIAIPAIGAEVTDPTVWARFESSTIQLGHRPQQEASTWELWRGTSRIEIRDGDGATGELWSRNRDGLLSYHRLFHNKERSIDYTEGDLRSLHHQPDWRLLGEVVDIEGLRATLKHTGTEDVLERSADRFQGQIDGVDIEVLWLEAERLPARVRQIYPDRVVTLTLKAVQSAQDAPWEPTALRDYQRTDYADIGDREEDPFLRGMLHHGHEHRDHRH